MRLFICLKNTSFSEILYIDLMLTMRDHCQKPNAIFVLGWLHFNEDEIMAYAEKQTRNTSEKKKISTRNFVHGQSLEGVEYHRVDGKYEEMGVDMVVHTQSGVIQGREDYKWFPTEVFNKKTQKMELRVGLAWVANPVRPGTDEYKQFVASHPMGAKGWKPKIPQQFSVRFVDD